MGSIGAARWDRADPNKIIVVGSHLILGSGWVEGGREVGKLRRNAKICRTMQCVDHSYYCYILVWNDAVLPKKAVLALWRCSPCFASSARYRTKTLRSASKRVFISAVVRKCNSEECCVEADDGWCDRSV